MDQYISYRHSDDIGKMRQVWIHSSFSKGDRMAFYLASKMEIFEIVGISDSHNLGKHYVGHLENWGIEVEIASKSFLEEYSPEDTFHLVQRALKDLAIVDLLLWSDPSLFKDLEQEDKMALDVVVYSLGRLEQEEDEYFQTTYSPHYNQELFQLGQQRYVLSPYLIRSLEDQFLDQGMEIVGLPSILALYFYHYPQAFVFEKKSIVWEDGWLSFQEGDDVFVGVEVNEGHFIEWLSNLLEDKEEIG